MKLVRLTPSCGPTTLTTWVALFSGVWVPGLVNVASVPFILQVKNQAGTTLFSSTGFTLTTAWQRVTASGSSGAGTTHLQLEIMKNNNATNATFEAVGIMLVAGATLLVSYNVGHTADLYDNVTRVVSLSSRCR